MIFFSTKKRSTFLNHWDRWQRVLSWYHEYLLHPGQTRTVKTIRNTMTWPGLTQDIDHWLLMFHLLSNDKKGELSWEIWAAPTQNSNIWNFTLGHGLCVSGGSHLFTIRTPAKTHYFLALTMIDPTIHHWLVWIVRAKNKSATSSQDLFHNTWLACYPQPQFIVFDNGKQANSNMSSNKCMTIMALKSN
jgi:hypothetical protein